ncbi:amidohydrolase [Blastopirellula sp. JC732]|uniref:Amidohydrolase n=1 Tax=Blastopirellula sediminis TaxID=2894196 RepID=A0A9X1MHY4_9BACT|nr:amidohydrolase [Blastopirellula sediminis]MCC9607719.1 amidohydrolase [Blastopirellula sediminis]MCC9627488.1 amidohydrolase [Blastopirellula sediminis]
MANQVSKRFVAGLLAFFAPIAAQAETADLIYHGGAIITIDDAAPTAEAVAVKEGKIVAVGKLDDVLKTQSKTTKLIDLDGRTMLPGFVDAHGHMMGGGLQALSANLLSPPDGAVKDIASLQQTMKDWMAANKEAVDKIELAVGFGYDNAQLAEVRHPTREDLDAISTEVPIVLIHQSGHLIAVNSLALEIGGITAETPNPVGGVIQRGADGKTPNGVLEETAAFPLALKLLGRAGPEGSAQFAKAGSELWARFGYTTAQDGRTMPGAVKTLQTVADAGGFKIDVVSYPDVLVDRELIRREVSPTYKNRFRIAGAKLTIDGSPQGFTAWRDRPYYNPVGNYPPGYSGYAAATPEQVGGAIDWAFANNIQILTHSNGEAASDELIAYIKAAKAKHGGEDRRPVLIHGQFLREDQVDSLKQLEIMPSLFPMHTFYWGDWHRDRTVGPHLADNISPTGWCVQREMKFSSHHDAPVAFPDSMRVLDATVTRRSRSGDILGPAQRVDVPTALKAMTIWPAWQHFEEDRKGSIEVGKLADFVILDQNPLTIDPENLDQIKVTETIKEGETIFLLDEKQAAQRLPSGDNLAIVNLLTAMSGSLAATGDGENTAPCSTCTCGTLSQLMEIMASASR